MNPDDVQILRGCALLNAAVARALIRAYPKAVEREALSEATEYKRSSRDTYLQRLMARRLVTSSGRGEVRASEELFG